MYIEKLYDMESGLAEKPQGIDGDIDLIDLR
jgi:hypothetical protein